MASTSASTLIPVEEYLRTDYSPDRDYVDGVILGRNVGEKDHNKLQKALLFYLGAREEELGIFVIHEQRLQVGATRYRVPDFCVVVGSEPDKQVFDEPPLVCVEIREFRVLSGSGRGSQVRLIGRFAPATPRFYRFPAGMDSSPSAQVQLLP